jgi:hypothetical protein
VEELDNYIMRFHAEINTSKNHKLWLLGRQTNYMMGKLPDRVQKFGSIQSLVDKI